MQSTKNYLTISQQFKKATCIRNLLRYRSTSQPLKRRTSKCESLSNTTPFVREDNTWLTWLDRFELISLLILVISVVLVR